LVGYLTGRNSMKKMADAKINLTKANKSLERFPLPV
jgi:hypothetical protein